MSNNLNAGLISSLPAILGCQVTDSIIAVMLKRHDGRGHRRCPACQHRLLDRRDRDHAASRRARSARNTTGAVLIAVAGGDHDTRAGDLLDALRNSLIDLDIPVRTQS